MMFSGDTKKNKPAAVRSAPPKKQLEMQEQPLTNAVETVEESEEVAGFGGGAKKNKPVAVRSAAPSRKP